ncbi:MAG: 30S ribosomal protein S8, partial [Gammaproteobacteria bacterium]
ESYIDSYVIEEENNPKQNIKIFLKYKGWWIKKPLFSTLKRISKPSLRKYSSASDLGLVKDGLGAYIISTNQGLMTDKDARSKNVGGEILCEVF